MKPVVMIVDDELTFLIALERNLQKMQKKWDLIFYSDPQEALDHLGDGPIDLVVSDPHLPGLNGAGFLATIAERAPETIRFALANQSDDADTLQLSGICHQVITKPCDADLLIQQARRALATRDAIPDRGLQAKVTRTQALPSRAEVHELIIKELDSANSSFESLAALVSEDIALVTKVMQIASSGFFSPAGETPGLVVAVTRLGAQRIKAVVRHHATETACAPKIDDAFSLEALWLHSVACATISQAIASFEKLPTSAVESAFVAGLVHDVGRLVMAASEPDRYLEMLGDVADPDSEQGLAAETTIFKAPHPQVGAYLVGLWGFSQDIVDAVAYHHAPSKCLNKSMGSLAFVHAAEVLSRYTGAGKPAGAPKFDDGYYRSINAGSRLAIWQALIEELMAGEPVH